MSPKCLWQLLVYKYLKEMRNQMAKSKSGLNAVQAIRYRELMWVAQFGDFMSQTEFDELSKLMKLRNFK
jgi:lipopolysaccharide/colanic/teichoic acid biosynthesis glycosyltransferase